MTMSRSRRAALDAVETCLKQFGILKLRVCGNMEDPEPIPFYEQQVSQELTSLGKQDLPEGAYWTIARLLESSLKQALGCDPGKPHDEEVARVRI